MISSLSRNNFNFSKNSLSFLLESIDFFDKNVFNSLFLVLIIIELIKNTTRKIAKIKINFEINPDFVILLAFFEIINLLFDDSLIPNLSSS